MPPWWLILAWIFIVPLGIRMLVKPTKTWTRPKREWAADHPEDGYSSGWFAQTELQAIIGLVFVAIATVVWLVHHHHQEAAHKAPPSRSIPWSHPGNGD